MNDKYKIIDLQLVAIIGFIIGLILSFLLAYNERLLYNNKTPIFDDNTAQSKADVKISGILLVYFREERGKL